VAQALAGMGYTQAMALKGGWKDWEAAAFPTEPKEAM
jgi:3-mercaptopyruvate sulfurtransferase SseA